MKVFFRADASTNLGHGHIMRCLALADELRAHSAEIHFICRQEPDNLFHVIRESGYHIHPLPMGIDVPTDQKLTQYILTNQPTSPDWLIIDHYDLENSYEVSLRKLVKYLMVIDDFANRSHDCDILLNQNYSVNENRYQGLIPAYCIQLLGPKYALLRPQFREARKHLSPSSDIVKRLFVFMGGTDSQNGTHRILKAIYQLRLIDVRTDVVIGAANPHRFIVEPFVSKMPHTSCHIQVINMAALMAAADIGIGAAGTTTWERCCVGLPSIVIILAENQQKVAENLDKRGIVINLGWYNRVTESEIKKAIEYLVQHIDARTAMSFKSQELVDGKGTERVLDRLID